ncbi:MAG TPA: capsule assembly Wzi family protein, partial [Longimicrobiaceae bacterium]|nr:capsule assembly Wzi family protein [Longimicrobiaceae bacterium]
HAAKRTISVCSALELLRQALLESEAADPVVPLLTAWIENLEEEYPGFSSAEPEGRWPAIAAAAEMGADGRTGVASPGFGEFPPDRTGATPLSDRTTALAAGDLSVRLPPGVWAASRGRLDVDGFRVERLDVLSGRAPFSLTVGRGAAGYGFANGGSVVLSGTAPLDRIDVSTTRPFRLPAPLAGLGTISLNTFVGQLREARHVDRPFLWGAKVSLRPHSRLTLAIHRAAMFGGDDGDPITAKRLLDMIIGRVAGVGFENQVVSVEGILRLPTESVLPLSIYMEWGAEDAAGAWWDVPGRVIGGYVPTVPGLAQVSLGVEYASLAPSCCDNPEWYRHWSFPGSWVRWDQPLGHSLGGHGTEWRTYADVQMPSLRIVADGAAFRRSRGYENLFVPGRDGTSWGAGAGLRWRPAGSSEIFGSAAIEEGDRWRERSFNLGARLFIP